MRRVLPAVAVVLLVSCGGRDRGTTPTTVPPRLPGIDAGTVLTFVSGETGAPVAGVSVAIGSQALVSDAAGQVRLASQAPLGASIDILHPAHLDRLSTVRAGTGQRFALWPKSTESGLSEHYTATLVYTSTADGSATGDATLQRVPRGATTVVVVPSEELLADGPAMEAHARAVANITEVTGGTVAYVLAPSRPASGIVVTARVDPEDTRCREENIRGYTRTRSQGLELQGAEVVYCSLPVARSSTISHELGHTFGLRHSPESRDLMFFQFSPRRATEFGPRESLLMRLMLDRPAGNRYPDNDRTANASAGASERVTVCY